jgi:hypothetical protein
MNGSWIWGAESDVGDTATNGVEITVPTNRLWHILSVYITLTASDTAGNRVPKMELLSTGDTVLAEFYAVNPVVAASGTARIQFSNGVIPSTEVLDSDFYYGPLPNNLLLGPGRKIKVYDPSSVDADSDAWEVTVIFNAKGRLSP